jgi:hypothetical protein
MVNFMNNNSSIINVFKCCVSAIRDNKLIRRESSQDKEFHFQNWIQKRLEETGLNYEMGGRNSYPDFRMVHFPEGYEVKGLAYPGRELNYDCNSQVPSGEHNGRNIFYIFGRYPSAPDGNTYPVLDIVICYGDFLNADHEYIHKNKSFKGFGSYGDIMIRDRKMYVAPTPFGLVSGVAHLQSLILPENFPVTEDLQCVGTLVRKEADKLIIGYSFDLQKNIIKTKTIPNSSAGKEHIFRVWRYNTKADEPAIMREKIIVKGNKDEGNKNE